jgi:hypothetical protein
VLDNNSLILQRQFKSYCCMPHLAWVEPDSSDVQRRLVDHWYLRESLVVFGPQVDGLLSKTTLVFAHSDCDGVVRSLENLLFLVRYYERYFAPFISTVIVEQGARPIIRCEELPRNCRYVFVHDDGVFDRAECFLAAIEHLDKERDFLILSDSDLYLETLDIRANLRMCEQYDCVSGFGRIIDLTQGDSERLRYTRSTQGLAVSASSLAAARTGVCRFLSRDAIQTVAGRDSKEKMRTVLSADTEPVRMFHSPNHALRLH